MKYVIKTWAWLNGKKLYIGSALTACTHPIASFVLRFYTQWGIPIPWYEPKIEWTCIWLGSGITAIGGLHRLIKYQAKTSPDPNERVLSEEVTEQSQSTEIKPESSIPATSTVN